MWQPNNSHMKIHETPVMRMMVLLEPRQVSSATVEMPNGACSEPVLQSWSQLSPVVSEQLKHISSRHQVASHSADPLQGQPGLPSTHTVLFTKGKCSSLLLKKTVNIMTAGLICTWHPSSPSQPAKAMSSASRTTAGGPASPAMNR